MQSGGDRLGVGKAAAAAAEDVVLDDTTVRRLVASLARASSANALSRAKHAADFARVAPSELALHDALSSLSALPTRPDLFACALDGGLLAAVAALLAHENLDIVAGALALLADFADPEGEEDAAAYGEVVGRLVEGGGMDAVVAVVGERLSEAEVDGEDGDIVGKAALSAMSVFENAVEIRPDLSRRLADGCGLLRLCVNEVAAGGADAGFSERRASATEVLALLLQAEVGNRALFSAAGGVGIVLEALAPYRRAPAGDMHGDEVEMVSNMFGVLCAALLECEDGKERFHAAEGVELMLIFIRKRKVFREPALKTLDFSCTRFAANSRRVFDAGGVGVIFAVFMKLWTSTDGTDSSVAETVGSKRRKRSAPSDAQRSEAEHVLSVLFSLFRFGGDAERDRLAAKFTEAGGVKAQHLLVMYADRLDAGMVDGQNSDDGSSGLRGDFGGSEGFVLQLVAVVVAHVVVTGGEGVSAAVADGLRSVGGLERLKSLVVSFADGVDESKDGEERERISQLASSLLIGGDAEAEEQNGKGEPAR